MSLDVSELSVTNLKDIRIPCFFTRLQYNGRTLTPIQMQDTHSVPRRRTLAMKEIKCTRNAIRRITNTTENSNGNISDNESSSSDQSEEIPLQCRKHFILFFIIVSYS